MSGRTGGHHAAHLADSHGEAMESGPHWSEEHDLPVEGAWQEPGYAAGHAAGYPAWEQEEAAPFFDEHPLPSRRSARVSKRVRRRRRTAVFLVVLALFAVVVFFVVQTVKPMLGGLQAADYPGPGTGTVQVVVPEGSSARDVAQELRTQDVVASEQSFLDALDAANGAGSLQPGSFKMRKQMKSSDAVSILLSIDAAKVHYAAVDQNLRIGETLAVLAKSTGIPVAEFEKLANEPALFGLPAKAKNLEGYLAPGEYRFPVKLGAKDILAQMVSATKANLAKAGVTDQAQQYRDLTIASILEFEGNEANYGKISGAIENRINNPNGETGGRLESDATVAYGLGIKTYNITDAQKADKKNLYNTFARPGLPVGPIGSPAAASIEAAAHPESNPYYFWVTVNLKTGETLYSTTYAGHLKNVAKYTAWCAANPGECK
ncbi:endolytic transglycosylase MltG [Arthrobacter sp. STN4]|uniref:endolytic transglycosylase MltG n=1 Tax=Arthrobacter sp. STN4 TaxID=2923276 RepID=UPI00211A208D|nr:endolytic transglycosylase MltG [Arthrobacter sp. STN4]MCQ9164371.1 endolytic transglycosylase MltG [Arthrobacter sp. STN4]